eukprot:3731642-Amphidinium_carterae.1
MCSGLGWSQVSFHAITYPGRCTQQHMQDGSVALFTTASGCANAECARARVCVRVRARPHLALNSVVLVPPVGFGAAGKWTFRCYT